MARHEKDYKLACVRGNYRQVVRLPRACRAGGISNRFSTRRTVAAPTRYPRPGGYQ